MSRSEICTKCRQRLRRYQNHARCGPCYADDQKIQREKHAEKRRAYFRKRREYEKEKGLPRRDASSLAWRRNYLNEYKLERGCMDCGYDCHSQALQFDHVRGQKLFNIGAGISRPWQRTLAEIAKCEVVCANCHSIRRHGKVP